MNRRTRITLGPVYFLWSEEKWRDFYFAIADQAPVDRVVIGETVCSKRAHFHETVLADVIERLQAAGKEIVFSTLALATLDREIKATAALAGQEDFPVELNDLSGLGLARHLHLIGPLVNVYNAATARLLFGRGATTICLPPELPFTSLEAIATALPGRDFEVMAFGRIPLAISARCAHARAKGRSKDNCQFVCGEDPDGLPLRTLERQSFLVLNGVQTVSHTCQVLLAELADLTLAGMAGIRLSPQDCDMVEVSNVFRAVLDRKLEEAAGLEVLRRIYPGIEFSNGFHHGESGAKWVQQLRRSSEAADRICERVAARPCYGTTASCAIHAVSVVSLGMLIELMGWMPPPADV